MIAISGLLRPMGAVCYRTLIWSLFWGIGQLISAPYSGMLMEFEQPDGKVVELKVWGDEFNIYAESQNGNPVLINPKTGYVEYARWNGLKNDLEPTGKIHTSINGSRYAIPNFQQKNLYQKVLKSRHVQIEKNKAEHFKHVDYQPKLSRQLKKAGSGPRTIFGMIILIDFPELKGAFSKEEIENWANLPGYNRFGNNGSVRDYFYDVSNGNIEYQNIVTNYYTAKNNKAYYDRDDGYYGSYELVQEALEGLEKEGVDFSKLTTDANGRAIALNIVYAGFTGKQWAKGIWPHRGAIPKTFYADGVSIRGYNISNMGSQLSLFTICHENGHMLFGWPDLYDYGGESKGTGNYCLMSGGADRTNPLPPNAYLRQQAGWQYSTNLNSNMLGSYFQLQSNSHENYVYLNKKTGLEMFIIESIAKMGRYQSAPDEGLMIWHVDLTGSNSDESMTPSRHYQISLEQADGNYDLEHNVNSGSPGDLFHKGNGKTFNDNSTPDAQWWDGKPSGLDISNISLPGPKMSFSFGEANMPYQEAPQELNYKRGLLGRYYEGEWSSLPYSFITKPVFHQATDNIDISSRIRNFNFGYNFEGYIYIPIQGSYKFQLESNDEAKLIIDDITASSHVFGQLENTQEIKFETGYHKFSLQYISRSRQPALTLNWSVNNSSFHPVPSENYFYDESKMLSIGEVKTLEKLFWNPQQKTLFVPGSMGGEIANIRVFNAQGRELADWKKRIGPGEKIYVPELKEILKAQKGLVFLNLLSPKKDFNLTILPEYR